MSKSFAMVGLLFVGDGVACGGADGKGGVLPDFPLRNEMEAFFLAFMSLPNGAAPSALRAPPPWDGGGKQNDHTC
jgi:hypothetical protein